MPVHTDLNHASVEDLYLDPNNPRLGRENSKQQLSQGKILELMQGWELDELASAEARQYKLRVGLQLRSEGVELLHGPVSVSLVITRPAKRGDLDNSLKVLFDSLQGIAYENDSQVVELHAVRHEGTKATAGVVVSVREVEQ